MNDLEAIRKELMEKQSGAREDMDNLIDWLGEYRDLTMIGDPIEALAKTSIEDLEQHLANAKELMANLKIMSLGLVMQIMKRKLGI